MEKPTPRRCLRSEWARRNDRRSRGTAVPVLWGRFPQANWRFAALRLRRALPCSPCPVDPGSPSFALAAFYKRLEAKNGGQVDNINRSVSALFLFDHIWSNDAPWSGCVFRCSRTSQLCLCQTGSETISRKRRSRDLLAAYYQPIGPPRTIQARIDRFYISKVSKNISGSVRLELALPDGSLPISDYRTLPRLWRESLRWLRQSTKCLEHRCA